MPEATESTGKETKPKREKLKLFGLDVDDPNTIKTLFWIVLKIWALSAVLLLIFLWSKPAERGQFGDMFGMVNALFSGLAFAGIIYTILLQREELGEQKEQLELNRQELELTREEMKLARKEYEEQNTTLKKQRFENTFFNMISTHFKILENLRQPNRNETGINYLNFVLENFNGRVDTLKVEEDGNYSQATLKEFQSRYSDLKIAFFPYFSTYIQSICRIYNAIKAEQFPEDEEQGYIYTFSSYISLREKVFLFYYILLGDYEPLRHTLREMDLELEFTTSIYFEYLLAGDHQHLSTFNYDHYYIP